MFGSLLEVQVKAFLEALVEDLVGGLGGGVGVWHLEEPLGWLAAS